MDAYLRKWFSWLKILISVKGSRLPGKRPYDDEQGGPVMEAT